MRFVTVLWEMCFCDLKKFFAWKHNGIFLEHNGLFVEHNGIFLEHNGLFVEHNWRKL